MKKTLLPLLALAGSLFLSSAGYSALPGPDSMTPGPVIEGTTTGYDCCWIYFLGRWWCIPCN
jgi:hypothetical protein